MKSLLTLTPDLTHGKMILDKTSEVDFLTAFVIQEDYYNGAWN
jgi:hypothetical protein